MKSVVVMNVDVRIAGITLSCGRLLVPLLSSSMRNLIHS